MPLLLLFKLQALCPGCQFDETADLNTDFCQYNASLWNRSILETVFLFFVYCTAKFEALFLCKANSWS